MYLLKLVFFITLFCFHAFGETTSNDEDIENPEQATTQCGPIESSSLRQSAQAAAACSPALLSAGLKTVTGRSAAAAVIKTVGKGALKVATVAAGVVGIGFTAYDIQKALSKRMKDESKCTADVNFKKSLIKDMKGINQQIIQKSKGLRNGKLTPNITRMLKSNPRYNNDKFIETVRCSELRSDIRVMQLRQRKAWSIVKNNISLDPKRKKELEDLTIPGVHDRGKHSKKNKLLMADLKALANSASCLPLSMQVEIACSIGSLSMLGKKPLAKNIAALRKMVKNAKRSKVSTASLTKRTTGYDVDRIKKAQKLLKRQLNKNERLGLQKAHEVGLGEVGTNGSLAQVGNYTKAQIAEKARVLKLAGFNANERRKLLKKGLAGASYEGTPPTGISYTPLSTPRKTRGPRTNKYKFATYKEIASDNPKLEKTLKNMGKKLPRTQKIKHLRSIDFASSDEYRPPKAVGKMLKKADDLPPNINRTMVGVYNQLGDKEYLGPYFKKLFKETTEHMARRGIKSDIELLKRGKISPEAVRAVLVKRAKANGDKRFSNLVKENDGNAIRAGRHRDQVPENQTSTDAFREAIRSGPFFDSSINSGFRGEHGVYTHMLQRDIVSGVVKEKMGGKPQDFWNFLGSKKGVAWWADLFDSGSQKGSFHKPENISTFIQHEMGPE